MASKNDPPYPPAERDGVRVEREKDPFKEGDVFFEVLIEGIDRWTKEPLRIRVPKETKDGEPWWESYVPVEKVWSIRNDEREGVELQQSDDGTIFEIYTADLDKWTGKHLRIEQPSTFWYAYMPIEEIWRIRNVDRGNVTIEQAENGYLFEVFREGKQTTRKELPARLEWYGEHYKPMEQIVAEADKLKLEHWGLMEAFSDRKSGDYLRLVMHHLDGDLSFYAETRRNGKERTLWNERTGVRKVKQIFEEHDDVDAVHFLDWKRGYFAFSEHRELDRQTSTNTNDGDRKMNKEDLLKGLADTALDEDAIKAIRDLLDNKDKEAKKLSKAKSDINKILTDNGYTLVQLFPEVIEEAFSERLAAELKEVEERHAQQLREAKGRKPRGSSSTSGTGNKPTSAANKQKFTRDKRYQSPLNPEFVITGRSGKRGDKEQAEIDRVREAGLEWIKLPDEPGVVTPADANANENAEA
ncbi:hypothetical protein [Paracoccus sp. SSK6]|uniref:hypothetical protein n=1 Tax=Paracoccus sp. SSK6 TaxID=3143131 RepID=UPI00321B9988